MGTIQHPASSIQHRVIYPVILAVSKKDRQLKGREKVASLSRHARRALEISARKFGIAISDLKKDAKGAPLPFDGNYWSLTHKPQYVGGVITTNRVGIDIEQIRPCSDALFRKTAGNSEWDLADETSFTFFFRYWTSKECVLKAAGIGIRDLSKCRIVKIVDDKNITVEYQEKHWHVEHFFFEDHIASVVKNGWDVHWTILREPFDET
jgi:4'-phosphopantetheinyl transferase